MVMPTSAYSICSPLNYDKSYEVVCDPAQKDNLAETRGVLTHLGRLMRSTKDVVAEVCAKYDLNIDL